MPAPAAEAAVAVVPGEPASTPLDEPELPTCTPLPDALGDEPEERELPPIELPSRLDTSPAAAGADFGGVRPTSLIGRRAGPQGNT